MTRKRETKSAEVYYDEPTYLFAVENRNTNAGMKRPSPTFAGLGFLPVPSGQEGLQSGARCIGETKTCEIATVKASAIERPTLCFLAPRESSRLNDSGATN